MLELYTLYNVHGILYTVYCTLILDITYHTYIQDIDIQCTLYIIECTLYSVEYTLYSVECRMYNVQCRMYTVQWSAVHTT